jgi:3-carboxy-cis,cis-muconate cycloisomerase
MNVHPAMSFTPETLFGRDNLWQAWLDVEAQMALAQGEIGMIPKWAADEIAAKAHLDLLDRVDLERSVAETMAPIVSLVRALTDICGEAGAYVHWGGTTQNIMSTGRLLLIRRSHAAMLGHVAGAVDQLGEWARQHTDTITAGRTNNRHALPITFGFKAAGWIEELSRQNQRFREVEARVFALYFGGAIGAMHSFDGRGRELNAALSRRLGLAPVMAPNRAALDTLAEYVTTLALFAMAVERIAAELYRLMAEEIDEVSETLGDGVIGSSTMPHKVNPKHVVSLIAAAARLRACAAPALEAGLPAHEGDAASNQLMSGVLEDACPRAWTLARQLERTLKLIRIHPDRMRANLELSAEVIASERLMMLLASRLGRTRAHDLVHHAVALASEQDIRPAQAFAAVPEIAAVMSSTEIVEALRPENYLGESANIAGEAGKMADAVAAELRARSARLG